MADQDDSTFRHGARRLAAVTVETYNAELRDSEGFIGDRASKRAFTPYWKAGESGFVRSVTIRSGKRPPPS